MFRGFKKASGKPSSKAARREIAMLKAEAANNAEKKRAAEKLAKELHRIKAKRLASLSRKEREFNGTVSDAELLEQDRRWAAAQEAMAANVKKLKAKTEKRRQLPRRQKRIQAAIARACQEVDKLLDKE